MPQVTYEKMQRTRERMFNTLKIDQTFEPFVGYTYIREGQKRILFVSYDEWSYVNGADIYTPRPGLKRKGIKPDHDEFINVRQLFRTSNYYKRINQILKFIKSGLTAEDVSFHNFVVRPIDWKSHENFRDDSNAYFIEDSIKAFKAVIDFANPDLLIFCSTSDFIQVNRAFGPTLNTYLKGKGIEWLESANLDYDMYASMPKNYKDPIIFTASPLRQMDLFEPNIIESSPEYNKKWDFDRIRLDLRQVELDIDVKYAGLPDPLQKAARFIDCELHYPGSFLHLRLHKVIRDLERKLRDGYFELMRDYIQDIIDDQNEEEFFNNPLCTVAKPEIYYTWHMLRAITEAYEDILIPPTSPKRKFCCSFSSETKQGKLRKNNLKRGSNEKKMAINKLLAELEDDGKSELRGELNKDRVKRIKGINEAALRRKIATLAQMKALRKKELKEFNNLIKAAINGSITEEQEKILNEHLYLVGEPSQDRVDAISEMAGKSYKKILNMIRNDRTISLESISKSTAIDEYYLSELLTRWKIKQKNGLWKGAILDNPEH